MTGVSPLIFWGSSMLWDNIIVWIMGIVAIAGTAVFQIDAPVSFNADHGLGNLETLTSVFLNFQ